MCNKETQSVLPTENQKTVWKRCCSSAIQRQICCTLVGKTQDTLGLCDRTNATPKFQTISTPTIIANHLKMPFRTRCKTYQCILHQYQTEQLICRNLQSCKPSTTSANTIIAPIWTGHASWFDEQSLNKYNGIDQRTICPTIQSLMFTMTTNHQTLCINKLLNKYTKQTIE